jgi:tetratricopeptide (TPR) repeat protein
MGVESTRGPIMNRLVTIAALAAAVGVLAQAPASAQDLAALQAHFDAGRYQPVVDAVTPASPPEVVYLGAQAFRRLGATDQAVPLYARLAARPAEDPWHFIGLSGRQLAEEQNEASVATARQGVALAPQLAVTHFQLGLTLARVQQWAEAAAAFDAVIERDPTLAYAYYYGGLMHYRANRTDRMARHFEYFLKLAPEAPERPEVLSIMRTFRR